MSSADLAAAAAFTAAGLSLVNVVVTARLASRGQREQWRREQERPIVARSLTLSADASTEWWKTSAVREEMDPDQPGPSADADEHMQRGIQLLGELRYQVAELDLLASRAVRRAASDLADAHHAEMDRLFLTAPGADDKDGRRATPAKIRELEAVLVEWARVDLGLSTAQPGPPPRSLIGKLLARHENNSLLGRIFALTRARE